MKLRKYLAHLVWIIPLVAWMSCGVISFFCANDVEATGECLKSYTIEHWHKYSPPTYTTHSVIYYSGQAFVIPGSCPTNEISWKYAHPAIYFIGQTSIIPWIVLLIIFIAILCYAAYNLFLLIRGNP